MTSRILRLEWPEKRNAIDDAATISLDDIFKSTPEVRVAILGAGGHFSAGLDLIEQMDRAVDDIIAHSRRWPQHVRRDRVRSVSGYQRSARRVYGGLGDLLATHAMSGWTQADRVEIAIALDSWWPTRGTRRTGQRNAAPRLTLSGGNLKEIQPSAPASWTFPEPF